VLGFGVAAAAQFLALILSGSGEGWNTPMVLSFALWLLFPLSIHAAREGGGRSLLIALAIFALIGDAQLIRGTLGEREYLARYVEVNGLPGMLLAAVWIILWGSWQFLAARSPVAAPGEPRRAGPVTMPRRLRGQDRTGPPAPGKEAE